MPERAPVGYYRDDAVSEWKPVFSDSQLAQLSASGKLVRAGSAAPTSSKKPLGWYWDHTQGTGSDNWVPIYDQDELKARAARGPVRKQSGKPPARKAMSHLQKGLMFASVAAPMAGGFGAVGAPAAAAAGGAAAGGAGGGAGAAVPGAGLKAALSTSMPTQLSTVGPIAGSPAAASAAAPALTAGTTAAAKGGVGGLISKGADWLKKNPDLLLGGISTIASAAQANKANRMNEQMMQMALERYRAMEPVRKEMVARLSTLDPRMSGVKGPDLRDPGNPYTRRN